MSFGIPKYVCIDHRYHRKVGGKCPTCGLLLLSVGAGTKIPRKNDDEGWANLWARARGVEVFHSYTAEQRLQMYRDSLVFYHGKNLLEKIKGKSK